MIVVVVGCVVVVFGCVFGFRVVWAVCLRGTIYCVVCVCVCVCLRVLRFVLCVRAVLLCPPPNWGLAAS